MAVGATLLPAAPVHHQLAAGCHTARVMAEPAALTLGAATHCLELTGQQLYGWLVGMAEPAGATHAAPALVPEGAGKLVMRRRACL
jgi:hypothetical protein